MEESAAPKKRTKGQAFQSHIKQFAKANKIDRMAKEVPVFLAPLLDDVHDSLIVAATRLAVDRRGGKAKLIGDDVLTCLRDFVDDDTKTVMAQDTMNIIKLRESKSVKDTVAELPATFVFTKIRANIARVLESNQMKRQISANAIFAVTAVMNRLVFVLMRNAKLILDAKKKKTLNEEFIRAALCEEGSVSNAFRGFGVSVEPPAVPAKRKRKAPAKVPEPESPPVPEGFGDDASPPPVPKKSRREDNPRATDPVPLPDCFDE